MAWKPPPFLTVLPFRLDDFRKEAACLRAMKASSSSSPSPSWAASPKMSSTSKAAPFFALLGPASSVKSEPEISTSFSDAAGDTARARDGILAICGVGFLCTRRGPVRPGQKGISDCRQSRAGELSSSAWLANFLVGPHPPRARGWRVGSRRIRPSHDPASMGGQASGARGPSYRPMASHADAADKVYMLQDISSTNLWRCACRSLHVWPLESARRREPTALSPTDPHRTNGPHTRWTSPGFR